MSKYEPLWRAVANAAETPLCLDFEKIGEILGFPIDHAFLTYKKELAAYGWQVKKISLKEKRVFFEKL